MKMKNDFCNRCILEIAQTEFCPRPPSAGSEWVGGNKIYFDLKLSSVKQD